HWFAECPIFRAAIPKTAAPRQACGSGPSRSAGVPGFALRNPRRPVSASGRKTCARGVSRDGGAASRAPPGLHVRLQASGRGDARRGGPWLEPSREERSRQLIVRAAADGPTALVRAARERHGTGTPDPHHGVV